MKTQLLSGWPALAPLFSTPVELKGRGGGEGERQVQRENICSMERNVLGNELGAGKDWSLEEELKPHPKA